VRNEEKEMESAMEKNGMRVKEIERRLGGQ
jgi:hypothetical protein